MPVKVYKRNAAGRRGMSVVDRSVLAKKPGEKRLVGKLNKKAGRNNLGRLTCRHRGGGEKRSYRLIDFDQTKKLSIPGKISALEYDPNRTAWIALVVYADGDKRYHLAAHGTKVGDKVLTADRTKIKAGNRCRIENIPAGFEIFNVELKEGKGGQLARSAGSRAKVVSTEKEMAQIQLPSSEIRLVPKECFATIGVAANIDHSNQKLGKAGRVRKMGRRPQVRGKVMNPCDHPHGGGEARNSIGMKAPKTPWGALALGVKTRSPKKYSNKLILKRRKPGRFSRRRK
ncbi:MAG: 50S ribosomal protein L2 [Candidatus Peribacteraceae bacterium]|nr:50S ribosomal protein L2 [Candidatus Peribacteraceae bacterium]